MTQHVRDMFVGEHHVAPARYIYQHAHVRDGEQQPDWQAKDPVAGWTVCGMPMLHSELWQPVTQPDTVCHDCRTGHPQEEQTLL